MTMYSENLKSIEIYLVELLKLSGIIGKIHLAADIVQKGYVFNVKGADISNPDTIKKFLDKGIDSVQLEITPKVIEHIIEKYPERYADINLDPNVTIVEKGDLESGMVIREDVFDERGRIILKKWETLKADNISFIKKMGVKNEYEVYEKTGVLNITGSAEEEKKYMPKVLIIDDQSYVTESLKMALEDNGLSVETLNTAVDSILYIRKNPPDLILLDINMPVMNGYQLLEELKKFNNIAVIPVVMLTARNSKNDIVKAIQLGAVDYIIKPFNYKQILHKINKFLPENKKIDVFLKYDKKDANTISEKEIADKLDNILQTLE